MKRIIICRYKCITSDLLFAYQCYHATWFSSIILVNSRCCLTIFSNCPDPLPHDKIYQIHSMQQSTYKGAAYHLWRRQLNLNSIIRIITKSNYWMHHTHQPYYCHHRSRVRRYHFTNTIIQQYTLFLQLLITSTYRMIITPVSKWSSCVCWH